MFVGFLKIKLFYRGKKKSFPVFVQKILTLMKISMKMFALVWKQIFYPSSPKIFQKKTFLYATWFPSHTCVNQMQFHWSEWSYAVTGKKKFKLVSFE